MSHAQLTHRKGNTQDSKGGKLILLASILAPAAVTVLSREPKRLPEDLEPPEMESVSSRETRVAASRKRTESLASLWKEKR